jgi:glycosyltransferase involved in cell wall biosynthesis
MKILHVIDRLNIGGAERVFLDITKLLIDKGVYVGGLLFNIGYPLDNKIDKRLKLHVLNRSNKYSLKKLYETHKICSRYDIIHVHMSYCYAYIRLSQLLYRGKYKILFHEHFGDLGLNSEVPLRLKYVFKPSYLVAVSESLIEWAVSRVKVKRKNTFLLKNTIIPNERISFTPKNRFKKAILISNIRRAKNIEFAIELSKALDISVDVYGNNGEDEYYKKIQENLPGSKVKIIEGISDFSKIYNEYDFAIHAAMSESGPLVTLEYMAYGIPFIAYNTGEVAYTLKKELPLHFMNTFDVKEWVKNLKQIEAQENISEKLKSLFNKYFSPENYVNECIRIYENIGC